MNIKIEEGIRILHAEENCVLMLKESLLPNEEGIVQKPSTFTKAILPNLEIITLDWCENNYEEMNQNYYNFIFGS